MNAGDLVGDKYRLVRKLGHGTMGIVWEASHELTSRRVAVKLIVNATEDLRRRLLREARAAGKISHRNVVEVNDVGQTQIGDPFLVMPLLSGETLQSMLKREGTLAPDRAARIGRDVARALVAAHAEGIVHRDLKPANVFLHEEAGTEGVVVKVLDFGVCKPLGAEEILTAPGGLVGSPAYMSPEQIMGAADLDPRTDLWSLGVLLFEMLAGQRPFRGRGTELIDAVLGAPIPRLRSVAPAVNADLDDIVARLLARDPLQRISAAAEVAARLEVHAERGSPSLAPHGAWFAESTVQSGPAPVPTPAPAPAPASAPAAVPPPVPPRASEASDSALTLPFQPSLLRREAAAQPAHKVEKTIVMAGFEAPPDLLPNGSSGWGSSGPATPARPASESAPLSASAAGTTAPLPQHVPQQPQTSTPWPQPAAASWPYASASPTGTPGAATPAPLDSPPWMRPAGGSPLRPIVIAAGIFVGVAALVLIGLYVGLSGSRPETPAPPATTAAPKSTGH